MTKEVSRQATQPVKVITTREQLNLPPEVRHYRSGKVRESFLLPDPKSLLIVTTDRISAFDVVMNEGVPLKGRILNGMSLFNFKLTEDIIPNHIVAANVFGAFPHSDDHLTVLNGRSVVVQRAEPIMFECVVRGYLYGSGLTDYKEKGEICGIPLPPGLQKASKFENPIFTPATKSEAGHDENISFEEMEKRLGNKRLAAHLRETSLAVYQKIADYALEKGIIVADTKLEFGLVGKKLILIDELVTPDSSRFWPAQDYKVGVEQASFDKQFVRVYLEKTGWKKVPPPPPLPPDVIATTTKKYVEAYRLITGRALEMLR